MMAIGLYTSRIVLKTLGVADFGLYNVIGGIVVLFSFLNNAMSSATQRFLNFELGRNDHVQLKKVFSASLNIHFFLAVIIVFLAETIGLWFVSRDLNIPAGRLYAANWVYQITIFTFAVNILRVPYNALIIAHERMSFYAYISIVEGTLKLLLVFLLNYIIFDKLILFSILIMGVNILVLFVYIFHCTHKYILSRYTRIWDLSLYKQLLSFSGWSVFGGVANVAKIQGVNVLINIFCGVGVNAAVAVSNQVTNALSSFVSNFQVAFNPQIIKSYAANEKEYLFDLICKTSKYSFFLLYILSLPVFLNANMILDIWLTTVPEYTVEFCRLTIVYMLVESISGPLWMSVQATGEIKKYQIIISSFLLLNIPISYFLLKFDFPPYSVILGSVIIGVAALMVRIFLLHRLIQLPVIFFLKRVICKIIFVSTISYFVLFFASNFIVKNILGTIVSIVLSVVVTAATIYFIGMDRNEKNTINRYIKKH